MQKLSKLSLLIVPIAILLGYFYMLPTRLVAVGDASELAMAITTAGIPHPPGYPLFALIGKLLSSFSSSKELLLINAVSAIFGGLSCWLVSLIVYELTKSVRGSIFAALTLGVTSIFWKYSLVSEVFTLNTFLVLSLIYIALRADSIRSYNTLCFVAGLCLTNHHTAVIVFPFIAVIFWSKHIKINLRQIVSGIVIFGIGLLPYLYLYILGKGQPLYSWADPTTVSGLLDIFLRRAYGTGQLLPYNPASPGFFSQLGQYLVITTRQFTLIGCLLGLLGMIMLIRNRLFVGVGLFLTYLLTGILFFYYARAPLAQQSLQSVLERFFILPNSLWAIFLGVGYSSIVNLMAHKAKLSAIAAGLVFGLPVFLGLTNFLAVDYRQNDFLEKYAHDIFIDTPTDAILLIHGDNDISSTIYTQKILKQRKDVKIILAVKLLSSPDRDYYISLYKHLYPDIIFPDTKLTGIEFINQLISANLAVSPVVCDCRFLKDRSQINIPSKSIGLIDVFLSADTVPESLTSIETEITQHQAKLTNLPAPFFSPERPESILLRSYAYPYVRLAHIYLVTGSAHESLRLYDKALSLAPGYLDLYPQIAQAYEALGQPEKAQNLLKAYLATGPGIDEARVAEEELRGLIN